MNYKKWRNGNRITLLENGEEFFPRVFHTIKKSKISILLETFHIFEDEVGVELRNVLLEAAQRHIYIKIMVDGYGSSELSDHFIQELTQAGVHFIYYNPCSRILGKCINIFRRLHRQTIIIDKEIAFIGGINFSAEQLTNYGPTAKQDYAVEITGPIVDDIWSYTYNAMKCKSLLHLEKKKINYSYFKPSLNNNLNRAIYIWRDNDKHRDDIEQSYITMLQEAQHEVIIANAYFFPGDRIIQNMRTAARRGVKIKLIVQGKADLHFANIGTRLLYNYLIESGIEIYEYFRRLLHSKVAIKDDKWSTIGSSNLDPLSLSLNLEANLIIFDRKFNNELRTKLNQIIKNDCVKIDKKYLSERSYWQITKNILLLPVVLPFLRYFPGILNWLPFCRFTKLKLMKPSYKSPKLVLNHNSHNRNKE
ncbi:MAG: cardiolipin synthase ClsB [Candidatus Dasytiphilus stammeri]